MGTLTLAQLQEEVKSYHGNRSDLDASALGDNRVTRFLNFAQIRLARQYSFPELHRYAYVDASFGSLPTDRFITIPSNTRSIKSLVLYDGSDSNKLEYKTPREFDAKYAGYIDRGRRQPIIYTKWQETIELMPLPDKQYQYDMRYVIWPTDLVNDSDTSLLDRKDEVLVLLAASIMAHSLGKTEKGNSLYNMFRAQMADIVVDEMNEPDQDIKADVNDLKSPNQYWDNPFIKSMP